MEVINLHLNVFKNILKNILNIVGMKNLKQYLYIFKNTIFCIEDYT